MANVPDDLTGVSIGAAIQVPLNFSKSKLANKRVIARAILA